MYVLFRLPTTVGGLETVFDTQLDMSYEYLEN